MAGETATPNNSSPQRTAVEVFFQSLEARTSDPIHLRLLKAARKADPAASLEKELGKVMEELLREA
jgi:hypothetical protein